VISFDFSAQATWPSDRPNSLTHTLTECKAPAFVAIVTAPRRFAIDRENGLSTSVAAAACARNDATSREASLKGVWLDNASTRRKHLFVESRSATSALSTGTPLCRRPTWQSPSAHPLRQHGHHRNDYDADQWMFLIDRRAWILQFLK